MKDKIFEEYHNKIYYWSLGKTKNKEYAKDLTNDIFVEIFIYINKNIEIKNLDNLIWVICYNTWKNKLRKIIKDKALIYDEDLYSNIKFEDNNIDKIVYKDIVLNLIKYALTEREKTCFNLYYKEGYTIKEISQKLNLSISNIKYYLYNVRKKIKENYND